MRKEKQMSPRGKRYLLHEQICIHRVGADWSVCCLVAFGDVTYFTWWRPKGTIIHRLVWPGSHQPTTRSYQGSRERYPFAWQCELWETLCQSFEDYRAFSFGGSTQSGNLKLWFALLFVPSIWKTWALYKTHFLIFIARLWIASLECSTEIIWFRAYFFSVVCKKRTMATDYTRTLLWWRDKEDCKSCQANIFFFFFSESTIK